MKIAFVLLSFMFGNVLADPLSKHYMEKVYAANICIQKAYEYTATSENVLEIVISAFVSQDESMDELNLMFAVPDRLEYPELMHEASGLQDDVRYAIQRRIAITVPEPGRSFRYLTLTKLGNARRVYTGKAVENIIRSGLKYRANGEEIKFKDLHVCRLAALYKNTKLLPINNSLGFIKTAEVDDTGLCALTSTYEESTTYYKQFEDKIFQVWPDNPKMEPLLSSNHRTHVCSIQ